MSKITVLTAGTSGIGKSIAKTILANSLVWEAMAQFQLTKTQLKLLVATPNLMLKVILNMIQRNLAV